jgi:hypothetical protein
MQPSYLPLLTIFGSETRHTVPLFQRPYIWNQADNWEPLWDDISDLADRVTAANDAKSVRGHFLGTVVLEQIPHKTGSIAVREIVDGQQRLTTLQIVLHAIRHAFDELDKVASETADEVGSKIARVASRQVASLTTNSAYAEDEEKYKVWPTNEDRGPFRHVMDAASAETIQAGSSRMANAYNFFLDEARTWLRAGGISERVPALAGALKDHLRLIVLDLEDRDEPQAIFETLNAHGTPLLPADLMKNWLLWEASSQKLNLDKLYNQFWLPFDHDHEYWRKEVGAGHAARARIDTFLQNWLSRRCREVVPVKHLYDRFVKRIETETNANAHGSKLTDAPAIMADICVNAARFRAITDARGNTRFDHTLRRLSAMGLVAFHPFLLAVMGRHASDQADRDRIGTILESYFVRRMICNEDTRSYGALCMTLLAALDEVGEEAPASENIRLFLGQKDSKTVNWPDDTAFERDWSGRPLYGNLRRERIIMILQALDEHYLKSDTKSEPIVHFDYSKLQIEHILPQAWQANWPIQGGQEAVQLREAKINTIGNLTLVSEKLNPSLSNAAWLSPDPQKKGKRLAVNDHSALRINANLVKAYPTHWDEACIDERAKTLFKAACEIWPAPAASQA